MTDRLVDALTKLQNRGILEKPNAELTSSGSSQLLSQSGINISLFKTPAIKKSNVLKWHSGAAESLFPASNILIRMTHEESCGQYYGNQKRTRKVLQDAFKRTSYAIKKVYLNDAIQPIHNECFYVGTSLQCHTA